MYELEDWHGLTVREHPSWDWSEMSEMHSPGAQLWVQPKFILGVFSLLFFIFVYLIFVLGGVISLLAFPSQLQSNGMFAYVFVGVA